MESYQPCPTIIIIHDSDIVELANGSDTHPYAVNTGEVFVKLFESLRGLCIISDLNELDSNLGQREMASIEPLCRGHDHGLRVVGWITSHTQLQGHTIEGDMLLRRTRFSISYYDNVKRLDALQRCPFPSWLCTVAVLCLLDLQYVAKQDDF